MSDKHVKRKLGLISKGKHVKKGPAKIKKLTVALIIVGALMVATSLIIEAENFPWARLFGTASQREDSVPDPSPLSFPSEAPASAEPSASMAVLPGDDEDAAATDALEDYNFQVLGILKIPVLKVSQNMLEGSGNQMKFGVGHVTGTVMPGEKGNCAISGHRPYPFRYLDTLVGGDNVIIKMNKITYTYQVYDSFEVLPNETWVLNDIWGEKYTLTLITCTPYMVSSHRLIIRARLTDIDGQTPAAYYHEEETPSPTPVEVPSPEVSAPPAATSSPQESAPPQASPQEPAPPPDTASPLEPASPPVDAQPQASATPQQP